VNIRLSLNFIFFDFIWINIVEFRGKINVKMVISSANKGI